MFELGNKAELLVAVWKREGKEGPTTVELTTDLSSDVVLHWGVKRGPKSDWLAAPKEIVPDHSSIPEVRWDRLAICDSAKRPKPLPRPLSQHQLIVSLQQHNGGDD